MPNLYICVAAAIESVMAATYPRSWEENHITYTLLARLVHDFANGDYKRTRFSDFATVRWDAYKSSSRAIESVYGDIAVLVRILRDGKPPLEGVGFMEAKRFYPRSATFEAINPAQLKTLGSNCAHTCLLLYDTEAAPTALYGWSRATVLPIRLAEKMGDIDRTLHGPSHPLAYQLVWRYLAGHDLDFDEALVEKVKGEGATKGITEFVMVLTMKETDRDTDPSENPVSPPMNPDVWQPLDDRSAGFVRQ